MQNKMMEILNEKFFKDEPVEMATDKYSCFDCFNSKYIIELKNRKPPYGPTSFNGTTMIEKKKYDSLLENAKKTNRTPLYIVMFQINGEFYLWNLFKQNNIFWNTESRPATTDFENNNMINKISGDLSIKDAVKII